MDHEAAQKETNHEKQMALAEGYREMAADQEQETEAEEWTEALVVDISEVERR